MKVQCLAPQLRTTDLDPAIEFYTGKLEFALSFHYGDFYAGVDIGGFRLHLKLVDTTDPGIAFVRNGQHLHLHFTVEDLPAVFDRLRQAEVTIVENICERPWGMMEFVIEDPDGHTIYLAEAK